MIGSEPRNGWLLCAECAAVSGGWRAYLVGGEDAEEDEEEAAVYCPEGAAREFGGP